MATSVQTIVIQCATTAERTAFLDQLARWAVDNPGQIVSTTTQQLKITVTLQTLTVVPS